MNKPRHNRKFLYTPRQLLQGGGIYCSGDGSIHRVSHGTSGCAGRGTDGGTDMLPSPSVVSLMEASGLPLGLLQFVGNQTTFNTEGNGF
jgi:hypothetical protein